jgi:two-component system, NtrC family, sensor histidine kinase PilS
MAPLLQESPSRPTTPPEGPVRGLAPGAPGILRWLYLGRLLLAAGVVVAVLAGWPLLGQTEITLALSLAAAAAIVTIPSFWLTHVRGRAPGVTFGYLQVAVDVLLVTTLIHVTGGATSAFGPLYVLVIALAALLLPLPGGVLIGGLASMLYFADVVWGHGDTVGGTVLLQIGLFAVVALLTGWLGDRVRRERMSRGVVESELRQLRLETDDILASISTGVITVNPSGRLVYMNPAAEVLLDLLSRDWQGRPILEQLDEVAPGLGGVLRGSLSDRIPRSRAKSVGSREGQPLTLGISTTVLEHEDGRAPSVTAIFQDITDQDRIEQLNRRNERLEAVAELSASMAHEIKNPLASIRSAVEQLTRSGLDDEDRNILRRLVVVESDRVSRLLSEFIEFSRLRMGEVTEVDLEQVARDAVALTRQHPDTQAHHVKVLDTIQAGGLRIPGDADLLHRAIFNLLLNGAQFAGEGGEVQLIVERVSRAPGGGRILDPVRVAVRDTGPGVPPEDVPRIFDPFFTKRRGGSGLGLAVVHRAVEAHQGIVLVESYGRDGGAEFAIYLPGQRADV